MVVMVGGKIVPNGSNYNAILTTTGGPAYMSEEKEEVSSVQDVEAEVVDDEDEEEEEEEEEEEVDDETREFENFVKNQLPMQINQEEKGSPAAANKTDPPAGLNSPAVAAAKAAVAAAVAGLDDDDDGGGKPAAKPKTPRAPRTPQELRTNIDPDKDAKFLATVEQLKEFKRINGHCNGTIRIVLEYCFVEFSVSSGLGVFHFFLYSSLSQTTASNDAHVLVS
jgi:hypothetical protein